MPWNRRSPWSGPGDHDGVESAATIVWRTQAGVEQRDKTPFERQMQIDKWVEMAKAKVRRDQGG